MANLAHIEQMLCMLEKRCGKVQILWTNQTPSNPATGDYVFAINYVTGDLYYRNHANNWQQVFIGGGSGGTNIVLSVNNELNNDQSILHFVDSETIGAEYIGSGLIRFNALGGNFIPLSGTETGEPVTGNIEVADPTLNTWKLYTGTTTYGSVYQMLWDDAGMSYSVQDATGSGGLQIQQSSPYLINTHTASNDTTTVGPQRDFIYVSSNKAAFRGISGQYDWTANITDLDYTQKKYVDDAIGAAVTGWSLTGNAGTDPNTNFIGTTDDTDLVFKRDDIMVGRIGLDGGVSSIIYMGQEAGFTNIGGNVAFFGTSAGKANTGSEVAAVGFNAGQSNTGFYSSFLGSYAGKSNSANDLTAVGFNAGLSNLGQRATIIGSSAGVSNLYNYVTILGALGIADADKQVVLTDGVFNCRLDFSTLTNNRKLKVPNVSGGLVATVNGQVPDNNGNVVVSIVATNNPPYVVTSQAAMLATGAVVGDFAVNTVDLETYILAALPASTLGNWVLLPNSMGVDSFNGRTGIVLPVFGDYTFADIASTPTTLAGYGIVDAAALSHTHAFATLTAKPTTLAGYGIVDAAPLVHTHAFADLTAKPTTLAGYGITDASPKLLGFNSVSGASYTLVLADGDTKLVKHSHSSAAVFNIPTNASVPFPIGTVIQGCQAGAGQLTITPAVGVTMLSVGGANKTTGQEAVFTMIKENTNTWRITGDITV
jgi:hypothetical protein